MSIISFLFLGFLILCFFFFFLRNNLKNIWFKIPLFSGGIETHSPVNKLSNSSQSFGNTNATFRKIDAIETGKKLIDLPLNVYGFALGTSIDSFFNSNKIYSFPLTNKQKTNWYFEVQKTESDSFLIGYISKVSLGLIGEKNRFNVFAQPWKEFNVKISIPFSKISNLSSRRIDADDENDILTLELSADSTSINVLQ